MANHSIPCRHFLKIVYDLLQRISGKYARSNSSLEFTQLGMSHMNASIFYQQSNNEKMLDCHDKHSINPRISEIGIPLIRFIPTNNRIVSIIVPWLIKSILVGQRI